MIRRLEHKDAPLMLEWMHEEDINRAFRQPFGRFTAEHAVHFIDNSFNEKNRHFAVVNETDEYLGTVSLKNISQTDRSAEYAIIVRSTARQSLVRARPGAHRKHLRTSGPQKRDILSYSI